MEDAVDHDELVELRVQPPQRTRLSALEMDTCLGRRIRGGRSVLGAGYI